MAMKIAVVVSLMMIVAVTLNWSNMSIYTPYIPVRLSEEQNLIYDPTMLSLELTGSIQHVLDRYEEPYRIKEGNVYITKRLFGDMDTLWNYTNKAIADLEASQGD